MPKPSANTEQFVLICERIEDDHVTPLGERKIIPQLALLGSKELILNLSKSINSSVIYLFN